MKNYFEKAITKATRVNRRLLARYDMKGRASRVLKGIIKIHKSMRKFHITITNLQK